MNPARAEELLTGIQGFEFASDLDRFVTNNGLQLWLTWHGKHVDLTLATPAGTEFLLSITRDRRITRHRLGEYGNRLVDLTAAHKAEMQIAWKSNKLAVAQLHFPALGDTYAVRLVETTRNARSRYVTEAEEQTLRSANAWPPSPERLR